MGAKKGIGIPVCQTKAAGGSKKDLQICGGGTASQKSPTLVVGRKSNWKYQIITGSVKYFTQNSAIPLDNRPKGAENCNVFDAPSNKWEIPVNIDNTPKITMPIRLND